MKYFLLITLCGLLSNLAITQTYFDYTPLAQKAHHEAVALRLPTAKLLINQLQQEEPDNLIVLFIENYVDFFEVFTTDKEDLYNALESKIDQRLQSISSKGNPKSPYYLYTQADILLQWATLELKYESYFSAFFTIRRAYKILEENHQLFPDFIPNQKDIAILKTMMGTIPNQYQWGVEWLSGIDGDVQQGLAELETVLNYANQHKDFVFYIETTTYYAYLQLLFNNKEAQAWETIQALSQQFPNHLLVTYASANIAMRTNHNDLAILLLENRPSGNAYQTFPHLYYMQGQAYLRTLNTQKAILFFQSYLSHYQGENFIKNTYHKLAWAFLLEANSNMYHQYIQKSITQGYTKTAQDRAALSEANLPIPPDITILKARLLFDGGYFEAAYQLLQDFQLRVDVDSYTQLEYTYRKGRVAHAIGKEQEAIYLYNKSIDLGGELPWYFACRAALEKGKIYESLQSYQQSVESYQQCLKLSPSIYRSSLHQQAKAGLARVKVYLNH